METKVKISALQSSVDSSRDNYRILEKDAIQFIEAFEFVNGYELANWTVIECTKETWHKEFSEGADGEDFFGAYIDIAHKYPWIYLSPYRNMDFIKSVFTPSILEKLKDQYTRQKEEEGGYVW